MIAWLQALWAWFLALFRGQAAGSRAGPHAATSSTLRSLALAAWALERIKRHGSLELSPGKLPADLDGIAHALYTHARSRAPGLRIPFAKARVRVVDDIESAGLYTVDGEGWVTIDVHRRHTEDIEAAAAVLCHEICHHILDVSAFPHDKQDIPEAERITDLCMYVVGFAGVFHRGRVTVASVGGRFVERHLGYHSADQYNHARSWVQSAWAANGGDGMAAGPGEAFRLPSKDDKLLVKLHNVIPHAPDRQRVLAHYRKKHPARDDGWILQKILRDYERQ